MSEIEGLFPEEINNEEKQLRSYIPSPFIVASLPLRDVKKNVFERKYNNITLRLTGGLKVPFGKYGRLLLSILTTHAVLAKNDSDGKPVTLYYKSLQSLLTELQLPKQRGKDIKEQLECFANASFIFEERKTKTVQKVLFKEFYDEVKDLAETVKATKVSTGMIPFFDAFQYIDLESGSGDKKSVGITILLSDKFTKLSQTHSVPIDYSVYKKISSVVGKDLYAWFVYRNNSLNVDEPLFIPRALLVDQFMPVREGADEAQERVNYDYIKGQIENIKKNYYPDLNVSFAADNSGITFAKSKPVITEGENRYILVSSTL